MSEPTVEHLRSILEKLESRPNDGVMTFVFAKGEQVDADHPAVLAFPHLFEPAEE